MTMPVVGQRYVTYTTDYGIFCARHWKVLSVEPSRLQLEELPRQGGTTAASFDRPYVLWLQGKGLARWLKRATPEGVS